MVLVTGGTGFLGAHLLEHLLHAGEEICALYRTDTFKYLRKDIIEKIHWIKGDILDVIALDNALQRVDKVYHCAGKVSYDPSDKQELYKINVEGTANVINCCLSKNIKKIIHVSSVAAIGRAKQNTEVNEDYQWEEHPNNTTYGKSKHLGEMEVRRGIAEGLSAVIVNPSLIIGPSLYWDEGSPKLIKHIAEGFSYYTAGATGFTDAGDVAALMIKLMNSDISGERFIINNDNWSYKKLFTTIAKGLGKDIHFKEAGYMQSELVWRAAQLKSFFTGEQPLITKETARIAAQKVYYSNQKIKDVFPSFAWIPLEKTIADACAAYKTISAK